MRYIFVITLAVLIAYPAAVIAGDASGNRNTFSVPDVSSVSLFSERYPDIQVTFADTYMNAKPKSPARAVIYSLILPGMGEWYADSFSTGRYLLGSEITLWLSLYGFHSYGSWLQTDARSFATVYAGADISNKDDKFFVNIGNFISREEYNEKKLRDRDIASLYTDPSYDWKWEDDVKRQEYRDLRVKSDQMLNAVKFVGAAIIANHIVSAIIAGNAAVKYNQRLHGAGSYSQWSLTVAPLHNGFVAGVQHTF